MYMRAALLALALGHASATTNDDALAALHAVDDAQLLAEVARRNLAAGPPQRLLQEAQYSFKYECDCERDCPTSAEPTVLPTPQPTPLPSSEPTAEPSPAPSKQPTPAPTVSPTPSPKPKPTPAPTPAPSPRPTPSPTTTTAAPTPSPTFKPTPLVCDEWGGCNVLHLKTGDVEFRDDKNAHWCDIKGEKEDFETLWCADPTPAPTYHLSCEGYTQACVRIKKDGSDSTIYSTSLHCDTQESNKDAWWCKEFNSPAKCKSKGEGATWQTKWCPDEPLVCSESGSCVIEDRWGQKGGTTTVDTGLTELQCNNKNKLERYVTLWCPVPTPAPTYDLSCDGYSRTCLRVKKDGSDSTVHSTSYYCDNDQYWCKNFKRPAKCEQQGNGPTWQTKWCPIDKITCKEAGPNTCILYDRKHGGQSIETDKTKAWCTKQDGYARWDATWCGDPLCDGYCGCGKGGCGKSKCGKGSTNCSPQKPPVDADDLGYCQKLDRNGAPVAGKTCWADGVDYYDKEECCGTSGNHCNKPNSEWHWCEKSDPIDPCEGYCYVGGKKNGGGYFKGKSYCRRKSSMQCYVEFTKKQCESWNNDYVWCKKD